jgi:hypothetical protein
LAVKKISLHLCQDILKIATMKNLLGLLLGVVLLTSCSTSKIQKDSQTYIWEGKEVSKRKYDLLVQNYTIDFVNNYEKKEDLKTFENLEVIYDTIVK